MRTASTTPNFSTADLYYAAYLKTVGLPMVSHARQQGKVYFVFDTSSVNLPELQRAWIDESGKVSAAQFSNAVKMLKSLCHMTG